MKIVYVIELNGKRVSDKEFDNPWDAAREAEAMDEMFPDRGIHDVGQAISF